MSNTQHTYETKCRRCGKITEWFFSDVTQTTAQDFTRYMLEKIQYPSVYNCDRCKMQTVQDVVSFTAGTAEPQTPGV